VVSEENKPLSTPQVRQAVLDEVTRSSQALEAARRAMVYQDKDRTFTAEDVHAVAMAQYELAKLVERFDPAFSERRKRR
jgi:hypothetical protein